MRRRSNDAQALLEVLFGIVCLVPVALVLLDLFVIFVAVQMNDNLCANAVRSAACGAPEYADKRARLVVGSEAQAPGLIKGFRLVAPVSLDLKKEPARQSDDERFTGENEEEARLVCGSATITTEVEICPILVHRLYGNQPSFKFCSTKTSPITFVRQAVAQVER